MIAYERYIIRIDMIDIFTDLFLQNDLRVTIFSCIEIKVMKFCQFQEMMLVIIWNYMRVFLLFPNNWANKRLNYIWLSILSLENANKYVKLKDQFIIHGQKGTSLLPYNEYGIYTV